MDTTKTCTHTKERKQQSTDVYDKSLKKYFFFKSPNGKIKQTC